MTAENQVGIVYLGMRGNVIALNRATGEILWKTSLTGREFVNVVLDTDRVLAATRGEMFCLDAATGETIWTNSLPGCGRGLITIATSSGASTIAPQAMKRRQDDAASAAVMGAVIAAS